MSSFYGLCPVCGERGVSRERRPNGNDKCINGHTYLSRDAITKQLSKPPLGLTPAFIVAHVRSIQILQAMTRYVTSGKIIPDEWIDELKTQNELSKK